MVKTDFRKEVDHVARLARLQLGEEEKVKMAGQLGSILDLARKVQELETAGIEPTAHVISRPAVMRDDQVSPSLPLEKVLQNAPSRSESFFRVPRITAAE